jgi:hypothetical protein
MGQYYKFIILGDTKKNNKEIILLVLEPGKYNEGGKLMEHSYINTDIMNTVEYLISKDGQFYKSRIVWAGDYAESDDEESLNLYSLGNNYSSYQTVHNNLNYRYIVNHTQKLYVDKNKSKNIHPLPLLISEGNGSGGGDYHGNNDKLCGTWARDFISIEETIPDDYNELVCNFYE